MKLKVVGYSYYQCCCIASATPTTSGTLTTIATDKSAIVLHYYGQWLLQEKLTTVSVMLGVCKARTCKGPYANLVRLLDAKGEGVVNFFHQKEN